MIDGVVIVDQPMGNGLLDFEPFDHPATIGFAPLETWGPSFANYSGDLASMAMLPKLLTVNEAQALWEAGTIEE